MCHTAPYLIPRETSINEDSFINEIIINEKGISSEIFSEYFGYQNLSILEKGSISQSKNKQIVKQTIDSINELRIFFIKKEISVNENSDKLTDIVQKIL